MKAITKKLIAQSLEELLEYKNFKDITTIDIVKKSGISKATFYRCFKDKLDVVEYTYSQIIWDAYEPYFSGENCSIKSISENVANNLYSKRNYFHKAARTEGQNSLEESIAKSCIELFKKIVANNKHTIDAMTESIISVYCWGVAILVRNWALTDFHKSPEFIAEICYLSIPDVLKNNL